MELIKVLAHNFMSYRRLEFEFNNGIWLMVGKNGAGKSAIFDAIIFALFGKTRGDINSVIKDGCDYCLVNLLYKLGDTVYRVGRSKKKNESACLSWGALGVPLLKDKIVVLQKKIERNIGMDYDTFVSSAYFEQTKLDDFMKRKPGERKELFCDILGLGIYKLAENKVKALLKDGEENNKINEISLQNIKKEIKILKEKKYNFDKEKYKEYKDKLDKLRNQLEFMNRLLEKKKQIYNNYNQYQTASIKIEKYEAEIMENNKNIIELSKELEKIVRYIKKYKSEIDINIEQLEGGATRVCNKCGSTYFDKKIKKELEQWYDKKHEMEVRNTKAIGLREQIKICNKRNKHLKELIDSMQTNINYKEISNCSYEEIKNNYTSFKRQFDDVNKQLNNASSDFNKMHVALQLIKENKKDINRLQCEYKRLKSELECKNDMVSIYRTLQQAFSKNGIPAYIIENCLPKIEDIANEILSKLSNSNICLKFIVQKATKSNTIRDTFDIIIYDGKSEKDYNMFSGGEKVRINIAIRLAISKLLTFNSNVLLRFLLIDEVEYLDEEGLDMFAEIIETLRNEFKTIMVISHITELQDKFNNIISVKKSGGNSRLIYGR